MASDHHYVAILSVALPPTVTLAKNELTALFNYALAKRYGTATQITTTILGEVAS